MPKTTNKNFELFKSECKKRIEEYGLKGWMIDFEHNDDYPKARASCKYDVVNRDVTLTLTVDWGDDKVTDDRIRRAAFHEVSEILLCKLRNLAEYRYTTKLEIDEEVHAIINTLENVVFK